MQDFLILSLSKDFRSLVLLPRGLSRNHARPVADFRPPVPPARMILQEARGFRRGLEEGDHGGGVEVGQGRRGAEEEGVAFHQVFDGRQAGLGPG